MSIETDIPIFKKTYDLYRSFYAYRSDVPRQDRYTLWQRSENCILDVLEGVLLASQINKVEKIPVLENTSVKLNFLRVFVRLMKDVKAVDHKRYIAFESDIDEIGRMLGGWLKSSKER